MSRDRKVLIVDNYDSFTYNLLQYLGELGAETVVRRNDEISLGEIAGMTPAAIVISPGPCTPSEAGISVELVRRFSGSIPILGVCLGHQAIAAAFGGTIVRAPEIVHGKTSEILHDGAGVYKGIPSPMVATRYHSLCVDESTLPADLAVTSRTGEGKTHVIMGIRHRKHPTEGVQFHPESILTPEGHHLLKNFLDIASQR